MAAAAQVSQPLKMKKQPLYGLLLSSEAEDLQGEGGDWIHWDLAATLRRALSGRQEAAEFVSGALAGAMAKAVLAPLETLRTRMVVGVGSRSIGAAFAEIVREGGWRGLWAGNGVNMLRIVPTQAIEFATFEAVRRALEEMQHQHQSQLQLQLGQEEKDKSIINTWALRLSPVAVGGAAAGIISTLLCHPLEVLKDRLTINRAAYPSLGAAVAKIHADAGLGGFYAGLCPTLAGMLPYSTCYYFMYDAIKRSYCRANNKTSLSRPELLLVGALSGLLLLSLYFSLLFHNSIIMLTCICISKM